MPAGCGRLSNATLHMAHNKAALTPNYVTYIANTCGFRVSANSRVYCGNADGARPGEGFAHGAAGRDRGAAGRGELKYVVTADHTN